MNATTPSRLPSALQLLSWIGLATSLACYATGWIAAARGGARGTPAREVTS